MHTPSPETQKGAVLIVSLVLLLVLTVLGVTAMQTSIVQERMAGNLRDQNLAFEAAEAGLRDGEAEVQTYSLNTDLRGAGGCRYHWSEPVDGDDMDRVEALIAANSWCDTTLSLDHVQAQPRWIIEQMQFEPPRASESEVESLSADTGTDELEDQMFRIISEGTGGSENAVTTLESIYWPR